MNHTTTTPSNSQWESLLDYSLAVFIGLSLTMAALAYFDVLFY